MKKILSAMRRAVQDFHMIEDGDKIAVGVSGGKDSLVLFESLYLFSKFSPEKFSLLAVNINMGFKETSEEELMRLRRYFEEREVPFIEEKTDWTRSDFRFVQKDGAVYAFALGAAPGEALVLRSFAEQEVKSVELLGAGAVPFRQEFGLMTVQLPEKLPSICTNVLKIS